MLTESTRTNENSRIKRAIRAKEVQMKENLEIIEHRDVICNDESDEEEEEAQTTDLTSAQELAARDINPMKLVMLLRVRFGIGRYEISRMHDRYHIRTPKYLSEEEIARCKRD